MLLPAEGGAASSQTAPPLHDSTTPSGKVPPVWPSRLAKTAGCRKDRIKGNIPMNGLKAKTAPPLHDSMTPPPLGPWSLGLLVFWSLSPVRRSEFKVQSSEFKVPASWSATQPHHPMTP